MTIKEKAERHRASRLYEMQDTAQKMNMPKERREASEGLWEQMAVMAGQSFKEGALFAMIQIRHAIEDAPEGSDIADVTYQKCVELVEGL